VYENATDCVEIKREKKFSVTLSKLRRTLCRLAPPCPFHLPFASCCDVAKAQIYSASTVLDKASHMKVRGAVEVKLHMFLTSAQDGGKR
jgi:hypothetical protein